MGYGCRHVSTLGIVYIVMHGARFRVRWCVEGWKVRKEHWVDHGTGGWEIHVLSFQFWTVFIESLVVCRVNEDNKANGDNG